MELTSVWLLRASAELRNMRSSPQREVAGAAIARAGGPIQVAMSLRVAYATKRASELEFFFFELPRPDSCLTRPRCAEELTPLAKSCAATWRGDR